MRIPEIPEGLEPLRPNAGGIGDPETFVGREKELAQLNEAVILGGAHMLGERRMGKTWLVKKLQSELESTVSAIYISAETSRYDLFAGRLLKQLLDNKLIGKQVSEWESQVSGNLRLNLGVLSLDMSGKLSKTSEQYEPGLDVLDLLERNHVVLIIDEITYFCLKLGPELATEFLSSLRVGRQSNRPSIVISGSVGLQHAIPDMKPVDDLIKVYVRPFTFYEAIELTVRLLLGIGMKEISTSLVADIIQQTNCIPYYIQAVVAEMNHRGSMDVKAIIDDCINSDTWNTSHYFTRLVTYYGYDRAQQVRAILDFIAMSSKAVGIDEIKDRMDIDNPDFQLTRDDLIDLVDNLEKDYYLVREGNANRMYSPLLTRIWLLGRRLQP
ncbi:MAG: ATP-binding protein [Coriobacteriia bacterium]|nr:ATP-binding protein [Coriobacteriia bacterium]